MFVSPFFLSLSPSCRWLFDNNNIDYNERVIATSIRKYIEREKEEEKKSRGEEEEKWNERNRNRIRVSLRYSFCLCHHMAWLCIRMPIYGFIEPNKQKHIRYHKWLINRINWLFFFFSFCIYLYMCVHIIYSSLSLSFFPLFFRRPFYQWDEGKKKKKKTKREPHLSEIEDIYSQYIYLIIKHEIKDWMY